MAISQQAMKEVYTIGKGSKKKDLVTVGIEFIIPMDDGVNTGIYLNHGVETGATTDQPYGLRPVSLQFAVYSVASLAAHKDFTLTGAISKQEVGPTTRPQNQADDDILLSRGTKALASLESGLADTHNEVFLFDEDTTRMFVLPKFYLGFFFANDSMDVRISCRAVFEKVKLTKAEYMEKLIRNI